jgi:hypothetical protein
LNAGSENRYVRIEAGGVCQRPIRLFAGGVTANGPILLRPAIIDASATCGDVGFKKKPLRFVSQSQADVTAVSQPVLTPGGDRFRDNGGDNKALVNRDLVYS